MNIAIYARVSTTDQDNENQLIQLREYCDRQQWTITAEYLDEVSGGSDQRPQFKKLFKDAHQRRFDTVLFWALDRFSREGSHKTLNYLNELESYGVGFKSFTEQYIDSTGVFKEAIIAIIAAIAKQERVRRSERTKAGLMKAKAAGKRLGKPPIPQKTKDKVKKLRTTGLSLRQIAAKTKISRGSVANILKES